MPEHNKTPFSEELQPFAQGRETDVFRFIHEQGKDPHQFLIKSLRSDGPWRPYLERNITETARQLARAHQLITDHFPAHFLPNTNFLIGHEPATAEPGILIVQEKIDGNGLNELINQNLSSEVLQDLDLLIAYSLEMWQKTQKLPREQLPPAIESTGLLRAPQEEEGLMPEIVNLDNILIGKKTNRDKPRIFLIETHSLITFDREQLGDFGESLDQFTPFIERLGRENSQAVKVYQKICEQVT